MSKKNEGFAESVIDLMRAQFGDAVRAYWWYDGDLCPCCLTQPVGEMMYNGKKALSVNAFMYRERGVLIAYLLCGHCGQQIMAQSKNGPTSLHPAIEKNLTAAYLHYLNSLDA